MDIESVRHTLEQANLASLVVGFVLGFIFTFNPVALASIPVSLAYVTKAHETKKAVLFGGMFIVGMVLMQALLGFITGFGGQWVAKIIGRWWGVLLGPLLIVLGLMWPGWLKLPLPSIPMRARRVTSGWAACLLGAAFAVAVCPACTPALVILLGLVAAIGSPLFGLVLLLAFALGRALPMLLGAVAMGWLESLAVLQHYQKVFEMLGALLLILSGLYMLNAYFFFLPAFAA
jgi:cytochrome c-type biogenesis protein